MDAIRARHFINMSQPDETGKNDGEESCTAGQTTKLHSEMIAASPEKHLKAGLVFLVHFPNQRCRV